MSLWIANTLVMMTGAYLAVGAVFALLFAWRGAAVIDHAASSTGLGFRLLVIPGAALLWPWLARKWARGDSGLPPLASARALRRRHLPMWLVLGPLSLVGLMLALAVRASDVVPVVTPDGVPGGVP